MVPQPRALDEWLAAVADLAPEIRAAQKQADDECRMSPALARSFSERGLFRMWLPSELGGFEVPPAIATRVVEAASAIDGSAGWCLGPGNVCSFIGAFVHEPVARQVFAGDWTVACAGSLAGSGTAVPVDGGFRLSGRWAFATNSYECPWLLGFFTVMNGREPVYRDDGAIDVRVFLFPADSAEIVPTWDTGELRGTASNDIIVKDIVADEGFGFAYDGRPWAKGALYQGGTSLWSKAAFAAVPLGIAGASVNALCELSTTKIPTKSRSLLQDSPVVRHELAQADAQLQAARAFLYQAIEDCWAYFQKGETPDAIVLARVGLACTHVGDTSRVVTQKMYQLGGGSSAYIGSPLDRCMRDAMVACQHIALGPINLEGYARARLGLPSM